jgi:hypothetical protein
MQNANATANAGASSTVTKPLALESAAYQANKPELLAHEGQWVVIHGEQILGIRSSYEQALGLGYERAGYVDFLVHQIRTSEPDCRFTYDGPALLFTLDY